MAMAAHAVTAANALQGQFTLGIGLSHEPMMAQLGIAFDRPIRHLREYLNVLMPLLRDGEVDFRGALFSSNARFFQPPENPVEVLVAALASGIGGCRAISSGHHAGMGGTKTVKQHIVPRLRCSRC